MAKVLVRVLLRRPKPQNRVVVVVLSKNIPVSVIVVTKNEEDRIGACLEALRGFDDVWVVDSGSGDRTCEIALEHGVRVQSFVWDGGYPKKRQWCLDHLELRYERVFFVDADEVVTQDLVDEIAALNWACAGYFVRGLYVFEGSVLRYGLRNNKLALFDRGKMSFPVVDDLGLSGMGEIEGHYQPCRLSGFQRENIGQLNEVLLHNAYDNAAAWQERHLRYAQWEAGMDAKGIWPSENSVLRRFLKCVFRAVPFRSFVAFLHSYIFKAGFLDGMAGYRFACSRASYYRMISNASKEMASSI